MTLITVGINRSDKGIEPWVALEDVNKPDDKQVLIKTSRLSDQGQGLAGQAGNIIRGDKLPQ